MADSYDRNDKEAGGGGFMMGLLTGTVLGAGLGMLLAPKAGADLRGEIGEQARTFGTKASDQYRRASDTATGWAERGREMVNDAREAVTRGAEDAREAVTRGVEDARGYAGGTTGSSYSAGSTGTPGSFGDRSTSGGTDYGRS